MKQRMLLHDEAEGEDECKRGRMRRGGSSRMLKGWKESR